MGARRGAPVCRRREAEAPTFGVAARAAPGGGGDAARRSEAHERLRARSRRRPLADAVAARAVPPLSGCGR